MVNPLEAHGVTKVQVREIIMVHLKHHSSLKARIKSVLKCTIYHKNGQPTSCFKTPVASMQQQMPTTTLIYTR